MNGIKILSLVQAICKRPSMYTPNGTAEEVMLILQGIFLGIRHRADENKADVEKLVEKYNGPVNSRFSDRGIFCVCKIMDGIKEEGYESDREILDRIIEVVDEKGE
jgi:hypothetical protein